MPRFKALAWMLLFFVVVPTASAQDGIFRRFARSVIWDFRFNNEWPDQFVPADRAAVAAPFNLMVMKGWQAQTTVNAHHFDKATQVLTEAGRIKVRWILADTPPEHRQLFVERGDTQSITDARMMAVQEFAQSLSPEVELPPIAEIQGSVRGMPANYIDTVQRKFFESTPEPRLPKVVGNPGGN